jgi:ribosome-associated protein
MTAHDENDHRTPDAPPPPGSSTEAEGHAGADRDQRLGVTRAAEVAGAHGVSRSADPDAEAAAQRLAVGVARSLRDDKCDNVVVLDVRGLSQVTDYLIIASGTSHVQMRAAARNSVELAEELGESVLNQNVRENEPSWLLVDLIDVIVHIFEPDTRMYYDLEMLWGDAERVHWNDDPDAVDPTRNRAGLAPGEARSELQRSGEFEAFGADDGDDQATPDDDEDQPGR